MSSRKAQKEQARARRLAREAELRAKAARKRLLIRLTAGAGALAALALVGVLVTSNSGANHPKPLASVPARELVPLATLGQLKPPGSPGPAGPEGVPIPGAAGLASAGSGSTGSTVDGIQCQANEQVLFHIHAHLSLFVNGVARQVPYGIGIPDPQVQNTPTGPFVGSGKCFYWLHTHAADGIVHIESPVQRTYTLGNFFDIWGQKLTPTDVGPAKGPVTALYNGKVFRGNPRDIPLTAHAQIQLEVGRPLVAPETVTFSSGL